MLEAAILIQSTKYNIDDNNVDIEIIDRGK
jgi:hypothetical protein